MCTNTQLKTGREQRKRFVRILWMCCKQFSLRHGQENFTPQNHKVQRWPDTSALVWFWWINDALTEWVDLLKLFTLQLHIMCLLEIICNNKIRLLRFKMQYEGCETAIIGKKHLYTGLYPGCTWSKNNKTIFSFYDPIYNLFHKRYTCSYNSCSSYSTNYISAL